MKRISRLKRSLRPYAMALGFFLILGQPCFTLGRSETKDPAETAPALSAITDMAGRTVELRLPAQRIILASSRHLHEFAAVGGADVLDRICGWGSDLNLYDRDTYLTYEEAFPRIDDIPDIGYHYKGTFSLEMVIGLNPDVVVFPLWLESMDGIGDDIAKLAQAGIPVVYIDYNIDPFNNPVPSTKIIGRILGREDRAKEITDFYEAQVNLVRARLEKRTGPEKSAYIEVGSKGPSEYGNSYSSAQGLGALIVQGGGSDIVDGMIEKSAPVNPEYLLQADPDVIIISGSYWTGNDTAMRLGYHSDEASSRALLESFTERDGWQYLNAVKNKKVFSLFHGFSFRIYNFAGIQAVAAWLYPDLFRDVDPAANFREFHEKFMPVPYSGVWMTGLDD